MSAQILQFPPRQRVRGHVVEAALLGVVALFAWLAYSFVRFVFEVVLA